MMVVKNNTSNSSQAPTLQSHFERTKTLKENNFNFGTIIYLKSLAERLAADRYMQANIDYSKLKFEKY